MTFIRSAIFALAILAGTVTAQANTSNGVPADYWQTLTEQGS